MDEPIKEQADEGVTDISVLKAVGSSVFMKWVEWAEKRVLVLLLIYTFILIYRKDQELSSINAKFMDYLMEEKKTRSLSIQNKQEILKQMSDEENTK